MSLLIHRAVDEWKTQSLHAADLPFEIACDKIGTDEQLFEAKKVNAVEWAICRTGKNTPAIFSYAAIFGSCDPMETGNLVPVGQTVPGVESERAESVASYRCSYSYSFDTSNDPGLYMAQSCLDKYMESIPGFNVPQPKPRRAWQSGYNAAGTHRFWMRWVKEADIGSRSYRANPCRPKAMALEGKRVRRIEDCQPDRLLRGDAVAFTFSVTYIEGKVDWYPVFTLVDIVRVTSVQHVRSINSGDEGIMLNSVRPALEDGELVGNQENDSSDEDFAVVGTASAEIGFSDGPGLAWGRDTGGLNPTSLADESTSPAEETAFQFDGNASQFDETTSQFDGSASRFTGSMSQVEGSTVTQDGITRTHSFTFTPEPEPNATQADTHSSSCSSVSSVTAESDDSGHWSDSAIEDGPVRAVLRPSPVTRSDDGHDGKRKKPAGRSYGRRTRARR
ncbi:hypothetical protein C8Q80DRAFT_1269904 [Daedaleopsis nitida]|nr:hypothetical protein C8Q80DRAFT_1269904 [Daedaleopsis nitida]